MEPDPRSPCESSLDCSNFNFFAGSRVFDLIPGSEGSSGDLRFLDALPSGWLLEANCEAVKTAASTRAAWVCCVGRVASSSSSD